MYEKNWKFQHKKKNSFLYGVFTDTEFCIHMVEARAYASSYSSILHVNAA